MPSSNKLNDMDRLSELFGNIIVITTNDVQSMNSVFGAIRRDREAAAADAAETSATQSAPGAALVAVESRKAIVEKQGGDVEMSRDNGKILSQQRRNEELVTGSTENDKFKPFKDEDAGTNGNAGPAAREEILQKKVVTRESFSPHLFELKPTMGGKQLGMFATEIISKNTEILREAPLILGGPT
ncbi:hypothetical protein BELL_0033g00020 [Botrytis elliptica]|uniref:Uncharacterized protein n=1 Tax=Botrytis elliptica TaxID=278938 RepID=A0A4Z1JZS2_9HELO|nr:hypothetical protein EAE99_006962 [Botrytis elliptica]TGO79409.1 hypothetical protein BELL_0033g00020 [Botrytis elliptica]